MEKEEFIYTSITTNLKITVDYKNLNIHIQDSWKIDNAKELNSVIDDLMKGERFTKLAAAGYTRTKASLIREWKAHNVLYRWGYEKERTGSVDLDQNESRKRRIAYFFLSWLF